MREPILVRTSKQQTPETSGHSGYGTIVMRVVT
jgi:hypothetical protein